jgi:cyclic-di-AMP phosphodiesterase PgpH
MSIFRQMARRTANWTYRALYRLRSHLQVLLKKRHFFWSEGFERAVSKSDAKVSGSERWRSRSKESHAATLRRSAGQTLLSLKGSTLSIAQAKRTRIATLLAILLLSACFGQRFHNQPGLDIKSVSPQTFYAPESVVFEDKQETEKRRNNVRNGAAPVLKIDAELTAAAKRSLETLLKQGRELRDQAGSPPFLNLEILSKSTQDLLFQVSDSQWQTLWSLAETETLSAAQLEPFITSAANSLANPSSPEQSLGKSLEKSSETSETQLTKQLQDFDPAQVAALRELVAYRELAGAQRLARLKLRLDTPRQQYRKAAANLALAASTKGQPLYNYRLFDLNEDQWVLLESTAQQVFSETMQQGVPAGLPPDLLRQAIETRVKAIVSTRATPALQQLTVDVVLAAVAPNLVPDEARTQLQAEQAVNEITPVMVSVQKGDLIVMSGETIDAADFVRLDYFGFTGRYFNWIGLCGFSVLVSAAVALYLRIDHAQIHQLNRRDHLLVLILCLVVAILAALRVPAMGLPAVGILVASFYGSALGLTLVGLLTLILWVGAPVLTIPLVSGAIAAMLGTWIAPQLRAREEFALLGGFVGLAQASAHLVLTLMRSTVTAPLWKAVFVGSAMHGVYGVAWSVVALGVSPYLEHFFDVVTPIRLAELSNPNRSLLKRLAAEAPGTFQHTISVANLAEAAARALNRNVELVRAGTLYHDIGKMHDPQGFIENQMGAPNKHDVIDNPWLSASIIKQHVTQGLVMARKYRLPQAVQAFIPEHQGDMAIGYFYQQAKERQAKEPSLVVNEADFHYDGPIPQSPETGITMLADSCEAALRSLQPEASIDEAYAMVDKILRDRWRNRQLADSSLSRDDLDIIASVFIQVWQQHNHKRISYPKDILSGEPAG